MSTSSSSNGSNPSQVSQSKEERGVLEQYLLPFVNVGSHFPLFPGKHEQEVLAKLLDWSLEEVAHAYANMEENTRQAALELLKEDEIVDLIDALPFDGEEVIGVLGDSISLDAQGWVSILKHLLNMAKEDANFTFINASQAQDTTTDALRRIDRDLLVHKPDWVFVALGTFDAQRLAIYPDRTLIPLSDTWENIQAIQDILDHDLSHPPIWISPAPVIPELLEEHALYSFSIHPEDLAAVQDVVTGKLGGMVDPKSNRMGEDPQAWHYIPDGLHHSLTGHMQTVREILKTLVEINRSGHAHQLDPEEYSDE
jgi:hypothetical protein